MLVKVVISVVLDALGTAPKKLKQQLSDIGSDIPSCRDWDKG